MDTHARQPSWISTAVFLGCLLWSTTPALGQEEEEPVQQIPIRDSIPADEDEEANGGVSFGVLAGIGLNDSEQRGRYLVADLSFVRPIGILFGGGDRRRGFERFGTAALRRQRVEAKVISAGARESMTAEDRDIFPPPSDLDKAGKADVASQAQENGFFNHGGTLLVMTDLLLVFPVTEGVQFIPFAGLGPFRTLENSSPAEGEYTLGKRWGLVLDYGLEGAFELGPVDLRVQYRRFRFQVDEVRYVVEGESFSEESDPINTSALLVGLGINF